jgi:hypothetical protein
MTLSDGALTEVIKLMASSNPDATIKATVTLKGGFNPCKYIQQSNSSQTRATSDTLSIRRKRSTAGQQCNDGFVLDTDGQYCYMTLPDTDYPDVSLCSDQNADPVYFYDDDEVQAFINITLQGTMAIFINICIQIYQSKLQ